MSSLGSAYQSKRDRIRDGEGSREVSKNLEVMIKMTTSVFELICNILFSKRNSSETSVSTGIVSDEELQEEHAYLFITN